VTKTPCIVKINLFKINLLNGLKDKSTDCQIIHCLFLVLFLSVIYIINILYLSAHAALFGEKLEGIVSEWTT